MMLLYLYFHLAIYGLNIGDGMLTGLKTKEENFQLFLKEFTAVTLPLDDERAFNIKPNTWLPDHYVKEYMCGEKNQDQDPKFDHRGACSFKVNDTVTGVILIRYNWEPDCSWDIEIAEFFLITYNNKGEILSDMVLCISSDIKFGSYKINQDFTILCNQNYFKDEENTRDTQLKNGKTVDKKAVIMSSGKIVVIEEIIKNAKYQYIDGEYQQINK